MFIRILLLLLLFSCSKAGDKESSSDHAQVDSSKPADAELTLKLAEVHSAATEYINTVGGADDPEPSDDDYVNLARSILKLDEEMAIHFREQGYWEQIQEFIKASRKEVARLQGQDVEGLALAGDDDKYLIPPDIAGSIVVTAIVAAVVLTSYNYKGSTPSGKNFAVGVGAGTAAAAVFFWIANKNYSEIRKDAPGLTGLMVGSSIGLIAGLIVYQVYEIRQRRGLDKVGVALDIESRGNTPNNRIRSSSLDSEAVADPDRIPVEDPAAVAGSKETAPAAIKDPAAVAGTGKAVAVPPLVEAGGKNIGLPLEPLGVLDVPRVNDVPWAGDTLVKASSVLSDFQRVEFGRVVDSLNIDAEAKKNLVATYIFQQNNMMGLTSGNLADGIDAQTRTAIQKANTSFIETLDVDSLASATPQEINSRLVLLDKITVDLGDELDRLDVSSWEGRGIGVDAIRKSTVVENMLTRRYAMAMGAVPADWTETRKADFKIELTKQFQGSIADLSELVWGGERFNLDKYDVLASKVQMEQQDVLSKYSLDVKLDNDAVNRYFFANKSTLLTKLAADGMYIPNRGGLTVTGRMKVLGQTKQPNFSRMFLTSSKEEAGYQFLDVVNEFILYLGK